MNTSAPLFADTKLQDEIKRQEAELYSRLYALAAEDFTTTADMTKFVSDLIASLTAIQRQLSTLTTAIASHVHNIPPHTHPITPHTHICTSVGAPTTPNFEGTVTLATPLVTQMPTNSSQLKWTPEKLPVLSNTTGAPPNIAGNRIIQGPSAIGPLTFGPRRALPPKALLKPVVPPILKNSIKTGI